MTRGSQRSALVSAPEAAPDATPAPPPPLERFFPREGLPRILAKGHPYDALETYEVLRLLYGYEAAYVNYGHWPEGPRTQDAGRRLALLAGEALALTRHGRLVDAGAGLGQAAVDLAQHHALASVLGVNLNPRQAAYARALAAHGGLGERVTHEVADACDHLATLAPSSADGVLALECVGHFARPDAFLAGVRQVLRPERRIAMTLNVARRAPTCCERLLFRASYGFVPASGEAWVARLERAGFALVERRDLTDATIGALFDLALARLADPAHPVRCVPRLHRAWLSLLFRAGRRAVRSGALGYELIVARRP